jgi:hypothetical protein
VELCEEVKKNYKPNGTTLKIALETEKKMAPPGSEARPSEIQRD